MTPTELSRTRRALAGKLPDGLIVLCGSVPVTRNGDVEYPFRQKSDFLYLTGVSEPGCRLIIDPRRRREVLFVPKSDEHHRLWLGEIPGPRAMAAASGIRDVRFQAEFDPALEEMIRGHSRVYTDLDGFRTAARANGLKKDTASLRDALDDLRAVKGPGELKLLREASRVSGAAHLRVMREARAGLREYQAQAAFEAECLASGLRHLGYPTIAACGQNASVLHYSRNDAVLREGELLLLDAGAEAGGYSADITRTYPVGARFSPRQRDIYSLVLQTQKECIERARPGVISSDLHCHSMTLIAEGLKSLGLLKGETQGLVEGGAVRLFYPHGLMHMLGLDVHDTLGGKRRALANPGRVPVRFVAKLEPGFVVTMEPGIYFSAALLRDPKLREKYAGSVDFARAWKFLEVGGVRIEDDLVIRRSGPPENLTSVPKEISRVEEIRAESLDAARRRPTSPRPSRARRPSGRP